MIPSPASDRGAEATGRDRARRAARAASAVAIALALGLVAYVAAWIYVALQVREAVAVWAEARRADGFDIRYGTVTLGGFPGPIRATLAAPEVVLVGTVGKWSAAAATVDFAPWKPERLRVFAPGAQTLTLPGSDGRAETWQGHAEKFVVEIAQGPGRAATVAATAAGVAFRAERSGQEAAAAQIGLTAMQPAQAPANYRDDNFSLLVSAKDARLPAPPIPALGRTLSQFTLEARFKGVFDLRLLGPAGAHDENGGRRLRAAALGAWRDSGGTVEVTRLEGALGPLSVLADGTLALDAAMQPVGAFTARLEGFLEAIDALRDAGLVRGRDAVTAKVLLGALARREANGRLSLAVPLTAQERRLYVGPVPLLLLPEVAW